MQDTTPQIYSLEDLVYFGSHPIEMFENYYLLDVGKTKILSELNEKSHIYNYGNISYDKDIRYIVNKIANTRKAVILKFSKSYLQSMDWLANLVVQVEYSINGSSTTGKTLFSKSQINRQLKLIERGVIKISISPISTIDSIEGCVRQELKQLFINLVENITSSDKDIIFRASNIDVTGMYDKFRLSGPEGWDLENESLINYSKIKNTIVEFCYYVNEDEMRSKLENVVTTFKFWFDNFEFKLYLKKYLEGNKASIAQGIYDDINVIATYKRAKLFCEESKKSPKVINYLDENILSKAGDAYDKNWTSSIEWLDYLISRFNEFIKRTHKSISVFVEEANSKIENYLNKLIKTYNKTHFDISFNDYAIKKLSYYKYIKSL